MDAQASADAILPALALARHERQAALDRAECLAMENLLLARRAAEAERHLEEFRAARSSGSLSALLGWSSSLPIDATMEAELRARTDENLQLQHAIFEQQREHVAQLNHNLLQSQANVTLLLESIADAERDAALAWASYHRVKIEQEREAGAHLANTAALRRICDELSCKCASTLDELQESASIIERLRERDHDHRRWRARLARAWRAEQERANAEAVSTTLQPETGVESNCKLVSAVDAIEEQPSALTVVGSVSSLSSDTTAAEPAWLAAAAEDVLSNLRHGGCLIRDDCCDTLRVDTSSTTYQPAHNLAGGSHADTTLADPAGGEDTARVIEPTHARPEAGQYHCLDGAHASACSNRRANLDEALAARAEAEARANAAEEELALSSERFQQQIGILSDALAEMHAKEDKRKRRQQELREQRAQDSSSGIHRQQQHCVPQQQCGHPYDQQERWQRREQLEQDGHEKQAVASQTCPSRGQSHPESPQLPGSKSAQLSGGNAVTDTERRLVVGSERLDHPPDPSREGGTVRGLASWAASRVDSVSSAVSSAHGVLGELTESMSAAAMRRATRI